MALLTQALALAVPATPTPARAACWLELDLLAIAQGDWLAGQAAVLDSRRASERLGDQESLAGAIAACAQLAAACGDVQTAVRLGSAAATLGTGPTVGGPTSAVGRRLPGRERGAARLR